MSMKTLLLSIFLSVLSGCSLVAQQFQFGGEIGLNLSGATLNDPGADPKGPPAPGFQIGAFGTVAIPVAHLSVGARLLYSYEGYSTNLYGYPVSIHVGFLKIPINLIYKSTEKDNKWFFGIGPYIAPSLGGHYYAQNHRTTILFGNNAINDNLKRVDIGADLMAGYQINEKIFVRASFDFGLINYVTPGSTADNAKAHTLNLGLTAGYVIGGK